MFVLNLCEHESLNGGEWSLLEAIRRIPASRCRCVVAAPPRGPLGDTLRRLGIEHVPLSLRDPPGARLPRGEIRRRLAELIVSQRPDVVHANSLSMSRLAGPVVKSLRVPSIGHLRDIMRLSRAAVADLNCHTLLLAVSEATRSWYLQLGLAASRCQVAYNGVDLTRFRPRPGREQLRRLLRLADDCQVVASIGQLGMRKGVDQFVQAAARIAAAHRQVHFVFMGQRYSQKDEALAYERQVRTLAAAEPLSGRFHFLGVRDDVPSVLSQCTLYVHAARQEPLGRVLLEAGASGCPIVATDVGGTREIYPPELDAAVLVPPDCVTELAAAIARCLDDPTRSAEMGQRARHRIASCFPVETAARQLADWYARTAACA